MKASPQQRHAQRPHGAYLYYMNLHKVNAAVCLHNYRQFRRHAYLVQAIEHVRDALRTYHNHKEQQK